MAMINGLLSVVVGIVCNALMYNFSCKYGSTQILMIVSIFYWASTIFVAQGGSSLAGIGLIMAALAPFAILKQCLNVSAEMEAASAVGLWGGIRALLIAVVVTVLWEIAHVPGSFCRMSVDSLEEGMKKLEDAFKKVFNEEDASEELAAVSKKLGDADAFCAAAVMEPRLWWCRWQKEFLGQSTSAVDQVRRDVLVMRLALLGDTAGTDNEKVGSIMKYLKKVPKTKELEEHLIHILGDAKKLTVGLLDHLQGPFDGLKQIGKVDGLDDLHGIDDAIKDINTVVTLPKQAPESMEADELCQLSIIFVMLEYICVHIACITKGAVRLS
eukprot:TRINITY_DN298_c0_g1_i1.p1 TRINITY_DN298_c0_g1~~TRINITY_DN298_c0_g1_i1.p1  ORF type:complete len:353 (+),score=122.57 TRINITY_DN298_c0_g1_i1:80-1060(+)